MREGQGRPPVQLIVELRCRPEVISPRTLGRSKSANFQQAQELIKLSLSELGDAIEVLEGGHLHPEAQKKLHEAAAIDALALVTPGATPRNQLISQAVALKNSARSDMVF